MSRILDEKVDASTGANATRYGGLTVLGGNGKVAGHGKDDVALKT
jgi:hypothetical protein